MPPDFDAGGFDCGEADLTDYLQDGTALSDLLHSYARTYVVSSGSEFVAYFTILADSIRLEISEKPEGIRYGSAPALKLGRMACDKSFRGRGIGKLMLAYVVGLARQMSGNMGLRYVTLDASNANLERYYESYGFVRNRAEVEEKNRRFNVIKKMLKKRGQPTPRPPEYISMRFDIMSHELDATVEN